MVNAYMEGYTIKGLYMDIGPGITALLSVSELLKRVKDANDSTVRLSAVSEIQEKLMAAYAAHEALAKEKRELETRLSAFEEWTREAERYELRDFGGNTFAHAIKESHRGNEPDHRICSNCFTHGQKSILQFQYKTNDSREKWLCPRCKSEFYFGVRVPRAQQMRSMRASGLSWQG